MNKEYDTMPDPNEDDFEDFALPDEDLDELNVDADLAGSGSIENDFEYEDVDINSEPSDEDIETEEMKDLMQKIYQQQKKKMEDNSGSEG